MRANVNNTYMNGHSCVSITLDLQKQAGGQIAPWAAVCPFLASLPTHKMKDSAVICFLISQLSEYKSIIILHSEKNRTNRNARRASGAWRRGT